MQEGLAEQWANHLYDTATAAEAIPAWPDFIKQLDASFADANTVNIARKKLKNLVQGRTPTMEYFLNFEYLLLVAGYDHKTQTLTPTLWLHNCHAAVYLVHRTGLHSVITPAIPAFAWARAE
jgi:hypothetical protein